MLLFGTLSRKVVPSHTAPAATSCVCTFMYAQNALYARGSLLTSSERSIHLTWPLPHFQQISPSPLSWRCFSCLLPALEPHARALKAFFVPLRGPRCAMSMDPEAEYNRCWAIMSQGGRIQIVRSTPESGTPLVLVHEYETQLASYMQRTQRAV